MNQPSCPPRFTLEAFFAKEPVEPMHARHFSECPACTESLLRLEDDRRQYLTHYPRPPVVPAKRPRWLWAVPAALVPLAAGLLLLARVPSEVRLKGDHLHIVFRRGDITQRATAHSVFRPGDALRFLYSTPEPGYLMILSRGPDGTSQVIYPWGGDTAAPVAIGTETLLPGTVALDDSPGAEKLAAVFRPAPFDVASLSDLDWSVTSPHIKNCSDCRVEVVELAKEP